MQRQVGKRKSDVCFIPGEWIGNANLRFLYVDRSNAKHVWFSTNLPTERVYVFSTCQCNRCRFLVN